ncbi:MAG: aa3-type cytochrome oxidase subunit II [Actinomycetes bacterium]
MISNDVAVRTGRPAGDAVPARLRRAVVTGVLGALVTVSLAGCDTGVWKRLGMPKPATIEAKTSLSLWQGAWVAAWAVGILVWGLIIWAIVVYRRRKGDPELPRQIQYHLPIEILWTIVPVIMVLTLFYFTVRDENYLLRLHKDPYTTINVNGIQWSWQFNYLNAGPNASVTGTPGDIPTLVLPEGKRVRFIITSSDVIHSFWVPVFLFKMQAIPGRVNQFEVIPDRLGTFAGRCAELCGRDHSRMIFNVKVVTPEQFQQYLQQLNARAA